MYCLLFNVWWQLFHIFCSVCTFTHTQACVSIWGRQICALFHYDLKWKSITCFDNWFIEVFLFCFVCWPYRNVCDQMDWLLVSDSWSSKTLKVRKEFPTPSAGRQLGSLLHANSILVCSTIHGHVSDVNPSGLIPTSHLSCPTPYRDFYLVWVKWG
jgi:hypothetical protein